MSKLVEKHQMRLKLVSIGDSGAGKTSLLLRQADDTFTEVYMCTIGVDFRFKTYQVGNISVKTQIWDTAGQERFRSIQKPYYKGANAVLLCFNLSEKQSFENLSFWLDQLNKYDFQGQVYLVGCKSDLDIAVPTDQILTFAQAFNLSYVQTSAKQNIGVHEVFQRIVQETTQENLIKLAFNKEDSKDKLIQPKKQPQGRKRCC